MQVINSKNESTLARLGAVEASEVGFITSLRLGKEKLDEYWDKMIFKTPYYYASVILHPDLKLA